MKSTLTSKGQITIPVKIRERLNLKAGDVLDFDEEAQVLLARPCFAEDEMRRAVGCLKNTSGVSSREWLEQTRGAVENPPEA